MTVHLLDVTPRDVTAEALGLLLDAPLPPTLAELTVDDGCGGQITLGVLGASHVVAARVPGRLLTEQVSCEAVAAGGRRLPERTRVGEYELTSTTTSVPQAHLEATAAHLRSQAATRDGWICGSFPGADSAVTALTATALPDGGWTWRTWHLYPGDQEGVIVTTESRWQP